LSRIVLIRAQTPVNETISCKGQPEGVEAVQGWDRRYAGMYVKQSRGHTHTGHTDRENTPDTGTHTRTTRPPNKNLPQALNNAQRWRDDGACEYSGTVRVDPAVFCPAAGAGRPPA